MQEYWVGYGEQAKLIELPPPEAEVLPGITWGRGDTIDTPAYWALRCKFDQNPLHGFCHQNGNLVDEIGFCMLGGFGITVEMNIAAFEILEDANVFDLHKNITVEQIRSLLSRPLMISGKSRRYRFPNQRAARLHAMRQKLTNVDCKSLTSKEATVILNGLNGIGPKTSAWILRNHYGSDDVAILDVHVIRACIKIGIFPIEIKLPRDYEPLQSRFIELAERLSVRPSVLDAVMWSDMRQSRQN